MMLLIFSSFLVGKNDNFKNSKETFVKFLIMIEEEQYIDIN